MQRRTLTLAACAVAALTLAGCGDKATAPAAKPGAVTTTSTEAKVLTIGATPVPHADILKFITPSLKKQGITVRIVEFSDYVQPNLALSDRELDANFFQHVPYLESFSKDRGLKLSVLASVHIEPMGVYSKKAKDLKNIPQGAQIAIPSDPTNGGRALKVLADAGILTLKAGTGVQGTVADITANPSKVKIVEMEASVLPRALDDVTFAVINSNFAMGVGLNPAKDSLFTESKDSPYANVVAIRTGDNRAELKALAEELRTPAVRKFIEDTYKGAVLPAF